MPLKIHDRLHTKHGIVFVLVSNELHEQIHNLGCIRLNNFCRCHWKPVKDLQDAVSQFLCSRSSKSHYLFCKCEEDQPTCSHDVLTHTGGPSSIAKNIVTNCSRKCSSCRGVHKISI